MRGWSSEGWDSGSRYDVSAYMGILGGWVAAMGQVSVLRRDISRAATAAQDCS